MLLNRQNGEVYFWPFVPCAPYTTKTQQLGPSTSKTKSSQFRKAVNNNSQHYKYNQFVLDVKW